MKTPRTICKECKFCEIRLVHPMAPPEWYDYRCGAVVHDKAIDPVTGDDTYKTHEAGFLTNEKHPNCRDMNDGDCSLYEEVDNVFDTDTP